MALHGRAMLGSFLFPPTPRAEVSRKRAIVFIDGNNLYHNIRELP